jgi:hypothetical protein
LCILLFFFYALKPTDKLASVAAISTISHLHDRALQAEKVKQNKEENERKQKEALENEEDTRPLFAPGEMDHVHDTVISKPLSKRHIYCITTILIKSIRLIPSN